MNARLGIGICCIAIALLQAGCVSQPQVKTVKLKHSFNEEEARLALLKGDSVIKGSALLRQAGGGVVTCAGLAVQLVPATEYTTERIRALYGSSLGGFRALNAQPVVFEPESVAQKLFVRDTTCDAQGYFKFGDVSPGRYFLVNTIQWTIPRGAYSSIQEGGSMAKQVTVEPSAVSEVVLAH